MVVLQRCRDGLNLDIFFLHPEVKAAGKNCCLPTRETKTADGYGADYPGVRPYTADSWTDASSPWKIQMGPDRNRHLLCTKLCLSDGRSNVQSTIK